MMIHGYGVAARFNMKTTIVVMPHVDSNDEDSVLGGSV